MHSFIYGANGPLKWFSDFSIWCNHGFQELRSTSDQLSLQPIHVYQSEILTRWMEELPGSCTQFTADILWLEPLYHGLSCGSLSGNCQFLSVYKYLSLDGKYLR